MRAGVRWIADVVYKSKAGPVDVRHHMLELDELQHLVEAGPDWHCIETIRIMLAREDGEIVKTMEAIEGAVGKERDGWPLG